MSYSAGSLDINVLGYSSGAITSIQNTIKALNSLSRAIKKINETQFVLAGQKLEHIFTKIASATNSINTNNITALATTAKSLNALTKISKLENLDFAKIGKGFENLTVAITPFIEKVQTAEASLTALYGVMSKASGKKIQGLLGGAETTTSKARGGFGFLNVAKWGATVYMARRLGRVVANIAQSGADYTETLNLWETSMGNNLTVATEFVNKMNEAYGISEKTLMNAQAIFKNMLGSLGQISDTMAYQLSEGITQMALDYASLYNVTFEQAFTKFQAALAGQVRPIRSVSGMDITETTLFQLYQSLGGTKTMRQLTRTEKQLLSIYAIFQQMDKSGAIGDLNKTMNSFANQSRVMAEAWQQLMSYTGAVVTHLIKESKILVYINAFLFALGDTMKAVADSMRAIEHFGGDLFESTTESALEADEALGKIQGKLLDFDKFRALNSNTDSNVLGIDETLLKALSGFDSILGDASIEARNLAEQFKIMSGLFDEDGAFNIDNWEKYLNILKGIGITIAGISLLSLMDKIVAFGSTVYSYAIVPLLDFVKAIDKQLLAAMTRAINKFGAMKVAITTMGVAFLALGIVTFINNFDKLSERARTWIPIISLLAGAITAVVTALSIFKGDWVKAISMGAIVAGSSLTVLSQLSAQKYANGGMPDKGTMFIAGEAGAEIVYNTPSGQSGVANIKQIEQAMYNALTRASGANGGTTVVEIDGQRVFTVVKEKAKSNGYVFSKA